MNLNKMPNIENIYLKSIEVKTKNKETRYILSEIFNDRSIDNNIVMEIKKPDGECMWIDPDDFIKLLDQFYSMNF